MFVSCVATMGRPQNLCKTQSLVSCVSSAKKTVVMGVSPKHFPIIFRFSVTYRRNLKSSGSEAVCNFADEGKHLLRTVMGLTQKMHILCTF